MLEYRAPSDNDSGVICGVIALPHAVVYIIYFLRTYVSTYIFAATYDLCDSLVDFIGTPLLKPHS